MIRILMAGAAIAIAATAVHAEEKKPNPALGAATGGATGAITGGLIGGPIGAAIGGVAGATLGAAASVPQDARTYVVANPVEPVVLEGPVTPKHRIAESVPLTAIPNHPDLAYVYVENRPVIVRASDRQVLYVEGDVETTGSVTATVPDTAITYIERHPVGPVVLEGPVETGAVIPDSVDLVAVPDSPNYGYIYVDERPILVERSSRKVVWVR